MCLIPVIKRWMIRRGRATAVAIVNGAPTVPKAGSVRIPGVGSVASSTPWREQPVGPGGLGMYV
jgi:hypothetical protein